MRIFSKWFKINTHYKSNLVLRFVWHECIKPFWIGITIIFLSGIFWAIDINFRPYLSKLMFDKLGNITRAESFTALFPFISALFISILLRNTVARIYDFVFYRLKVQIRTRINETVMSSIMNRSHLFLHNNVSGALSNRVQFLTKNLPVFVNLIMHNFGAHFIAFAISLYLFWNISPLFAIVLVCWATVFISCTFFFSIKTKDLVAKSDKKQSIFFHQIFDVLHNVFRIKTFNKTKLEMERLAEYRDALNKADIKRDNWAMFVAITQTASYVIYQLACFLLLIYFYKKDSVTIGDFILIFTINRDTIDYMWVLAEDITKFNEHYFYIKGVLNNVFTAYKPAERLEAQVEPKKINLKSHNIKFENIHFKYSSKSAVLFENLSISIKNKEKVGVVGYSGSGKSSLVKLLLRLYEPDSGSIKIGGKDIKTLDKSSFLNMFAVIEQDPSLFNRTIAENIAYGKMDATEKEIIAAAKKAQAHDFIMKTTKQYDTVVGHEGSNLSIGQRQRIAIACAILKNAPIFIMDEATASLDGVTESKISNSLDMVMKNKTAIIIAHKLETLISLDKILVFAGGKIVQNGTHEQLMKQKGLYRDLLKSQRKIA